MRAILEAGAQILEEQGVAGATTDRIAQRAGVSVGSLYQYFPSKEAIVATLARCHAIEAGRALEPAFEGLERPGPLDPALAALVRVFVETHQARPRLHRILFEHAPLDPEHTREVESALDRLAVRLARALAARAELHLADPELAARLVLETLVALSHRFAIDPATRASAASREAEIACLVRGYLLGAGRD